MEQSVLAQTQNVGPRCLEGDWVVSEGVSGGCLRGLWVVSGGVSGGLGTRRGQGGSGRGWGGVWTVPGGHLVCVWLGSRRGLGGV